MGAVGAAAPTDFEKIDFAPTDFEKGWPGNRDFFLKENQFSYRFGVISENLHQQFWNPNKAPDKA